MLFELEETSKIIDFLSAFRYYNYLEMKKKVYIETYGCQMNVADSDLVLGMLDKNGYETVKDVGQADVILVNTCSIRENAERRIYGRLGEFKRVKRRRPVVVGVLGCMAERMRHDLMGEKARGVGHVVDLIVGPDEYRRVPGLIERAWHGERGIAVKLSRVETYDDLPPLRTRGVSAWISVMRGCDKFCTFCVVPFTRGRERSRALASIVKEVEELSRQGFREVMLLGQNVNSYRDGGCDFAALLQAVADVDRSMRVRFTTSHPSDMSDKLITTIADNTNVCNFIHLPVQSGSDRVLRLMNRTYDVGHYRQLIKKIRSEIPGVSLSTDIIVGFPTETEEDHLETLDLMAEIRYDGAFMFKYSPRENTPAWRMDNDVDDSTKTRRISEIIQTQKTIAQEINDRLVGRTVEVLVEGPSKKSVDEFMGRTDTNKTVVFPAVSGIRPGDFHLVKISRVNSATLFGTGVSNYQEDVIHEPSATVEEIL